MFHHDLKQAIREVPGFPKPGINFYDVTTLFSDRSAFRTAVEGLAARYRGAALPDAVVGIEARGFVLAAALAFDLGLGVILARKPGKLPCAAEAETYALEYGTARIEIHRDAIVAGQKVLVVDDVLATGGTARAAGAIVERLGGTVHGYAFLVELQFLNGRKRIDGAEVFSLIQYAA